MTTIDDLLDVVPSWLNGRVDGVRVGSDGTSTVTGITHDSRQVQPQWMFACLRGHHFDGHQFAAAAVAAGASSLLVDPAGQAGLGAEVDVVRLVVDDTRQALGPVAATVYGHPSKQLQLIGVTGTNGKTTTAAMLGAILRAGGTHAEVLGTLTAVHTTPEAPDLQHRLRDIVDAGGTAVVMEVSSHGLALHRVDGATFAAAVFTNLGRDHLDLHGTQEAYFRAKAKLFETERAALGVCNIDDLHGRLLYEAADIEMVAYSLDDVDEVVVEAGAIRFRWDGAAIAVPIGGSFNVMNALAAATTARALGISIDQIVTGLAALDVVPGRFEQVRTSGGTTPTTVIVDFAHTPDGLAEVVASARPLVGAGGTLTLVFGAGGDRDRDKRPQMGAVAAGAADRVIVTSDNPRTEDPAAIIAAIVDGVRSGDRDRVETIADRHQAIAAAVAGARPDDVVIIAGKGHEATQTIGADTLAFDDRAVARAALEALEAGDSSEASR